MELTDIFFFRDYKCYLIASGKFQGYQSQRQLVPTFKMHAINILNKSENFHFFIYREPNFNVKLFLFAFVPVLLLSTVKITNNTPLSAKKRVELIQGDNSDDNRLHHNMASMV